MSVGMMLQSYDMVARKYGKLAGSPEGAEFKRMLDIANSRGLNYFIELAYTKGLLQSAARESQNMALLPCLTSLVIELSKTGVARESKDFTNCVFACQKVYRGDPDYLITDIRDNIF